MKSVILAGGYATRLWPMTQNVPKALLDVNGKPIMEYIIREVEKIDDVEEIFISTNSKFRKNFREFIKGFDSSKKITLVIEPTQSEEEKFGAIGGLNYLINSKKVNDDLLVIAGDNIFEFELRNYMEQYSGSVMLAAHDVGSYQLAKSYGVLIADENNKVTDFEEKPKEPRSTLVSTAVYLFPKDSVPRIKSYIDEGNAADRIGDFIGWMLDHEDVYVYKFNEKWFDIGSHDTLKEAKFHYELNA